MKIVVIQDYLRMGGTEMQAVSMVAGFQSKGWDAQLLTLRPGGPLLERTERLGLKVNCLQPFDYKLNWAHPGLHKEIHRIGPDCILLMGRNGNSIGGKIIHSFPQMKVFGTFRTGRKLPKAYIETLQNCHHIFTNSNWGLDQLNSLDIGSGKISVIPNGIVHEDIESEDSSYRENARKELGIPSDRVVLIKVAAFRKGKNHAGLLKQLSKFEGNWELWLVGEGPELQACRRLTDQLELNERVRFLGQQSNLNKLYHGADIAVLYSTEDSLPNFLVEAQAAGLPVVALDCAGVAETFIDGKTGCLVDLDNGDDFLGALTRVIEDEPLRARMSQEAQVWAQEQFCPSARLNDYALKIQELVG
ncbi:MAG: glycosyltransferase family 4 protein [Opitutae bacterium]